MAPRSFRVLFQVSSAGGIISAVVLARLQTYIATGSQPERYRTTGFSKAIGIVTRRGRGMAGNGAARSTIETAS